MFIDEFYKLIKWYHRVLDLWWFFWESGVYFGLHNSIVDVYEADPDIYLYTVKNCSPYKNINVYNYAVVASDDESLYFDDGEWFTMWWSVSREQTNKKVMCKHIERILDEHCYDAIKIDIEWAEFPICERITINKKWTSFKIWYIEFHFFTEEQKKCDIIMNNTISCLKSLWFMVRAFDPFNHWEEIDLLSLDCQKYPCLYIIFEKDD